jgi:hypothetical protein
MEVSALKEVLICLLLECLLLNFVTVMTECDTVFLALVCLHVTLLISLFIMRLPSDNADLDIDGSVQ